jgi:hypothetical protein
MKMDWNLSLDLEMVMAKAMVEMFPPDFELLLLVLAGYEQIFVY